MPNGDEVTSKDELREMILEFGAAAGRALIEGAEEYDLTKCSREEKIKVGDTNWDIDVYYDRDRQIVLIQGELERKDEYPEGMPDFLKQIIDQGRGSSDEFSFTVPVAWLPQAPSLA